MFDDAFRSSLAWQPDGPESEDDGPGASAVRWMRPDNEAPGVLGLGQVVTRTADAALLLLGVSVYSTGAVLDLALLRRVEADPMAERYQPMDHGLLVGVETADGSVATSIGPSMPGLRDPEDVQVPVLNPLGGGGGGRTYELSYWLTPVPPPGDLVVLAVGEPLGLPEGRVVVPGVALAEARGQCERLWPREPERQWSPQDLPRPEVPRGGWFERALEGDGPTA
jgi:hypothetical protein